VDDVDHLAEGLVSVSEKLFLIDHAAGEIARGDRGAGRGDRDPERDWSGSAEFQ